MGADEKISLGELLKDVPVSRQDVLDRFLKYISFDTQSNPESEVCPSTKSQLDFAKILVDECKQIGLKDVELDENGYVYATLPANCSQINTKKVGFISHMDTSPDFSGKDITPNIVKNYDGGDILLCSEPKKIFLSPEQFPALKNYIGEDLVVTDGKTLLGADDKAGVAEIITAMDYLVKNDDKIKHGPVKIAFTPDEEIGRGADRFDVEKFNCDFAFTMDGGQIGELQYENFNAAKARITVYGKNVHPGEAKNSMLNSILIAHEIINLFPKDEVPEKTDGYAGFYHLHNFCGNVSETTFEYIIRDFDAKNFSARKNFIKSVVTKMKQKFNCEIDLKLVDQYYNMKDRIDFGVVELARKAFGNVGLETLEIPIRGGTDGASLSYKGLPCPNIFAGGHNFHGPYEFVPVNSMVRAVEVILGIVGLF